MKRRRDVQRQPVCDRERSVLPNLPANQATIGRLPRLPETPVKQSPGLVSLVVRGDPYGNMWDPLQATDSHSRLRNEGR